MLVNIGLDSQQRSLISYFDPVRIDNFESLDLEELIERLSDIEDLSGVFFSIDVLPKLFVSSLRLKFPDILIFGFTEDTSLESIANKRVSLLRNKGNDLFNSNSLQFEIKAVVDYHQDYFPFRNSNMHFSYILTKDIRLLIDKFNRKIILNQFEKETSIHLSKTEFDILIHLINKKGNPVSQESLFTSIFDSDVSSKLLNVYICKIRRKLNDAILDSEDLKSSRIIETIRGLGYRMAIGKIA